MWYILVDSFNLPKLVHLMVQTSCHALHFSFSMTYNIEIETTE